MINTDGLRKTVIKGLKQYLGCEIVRANQTATMPEYPYVGYNITTHSSENKGTYSEWENEHKAVKPVVQTWSITAKSNNYNEAVELANKAHDWLDYAGTQYLNDNDVIIQSVGSVSDRSNLLTNEYEYAYGFDCFFSVTDEIDIPNNGYIENIIHHPIIKEE